MVGYWGIGSLAVVVALAALPAEGAERVALLSIGCVCGLIAVGVLLVAKRRKRRLRNVPRSGLTPNVPRSDLNVGPRFPQAVEQKATPADGTAAAPPLSQSTGIKAEGVDGLYLSDNVIQGFDVPLDVKNSKNVHGWRNKFRR